MINISSIADLKNRTLVESNTLKSFILSSGISTDGFRTPIRDDILIHDYQMANSITINTILSNYIVNLKYAWDNYFNPRYVQTDSYFKIVGESVDSGLGDDTSMFLKVSDGAGIFYRREIELDARTSVQDDGTLRYVNLDSVWYGVQEVVVTVDSGEVDDDGNPIRVPLLDSDEKMITTNHLVIAPEPMNDFVVNPNPFGQNPFDAPFPDNPSTEEDEFRGSFNQMMDYLAGDRMESLTVNCIVENLFYANKFTEQTDDYLAYYMLPESRYIVCAANGLFGVAPQYSNGQFTGMRIYNIGLAIPNINQTKYANHKYDFLWCGFASIDEEATLFIVFRDLTEGGGYHYAYLNASTYDRTYGFVKIRQLVNDTLVVDPDNVFSKVESIRELDNVTIALTNYGFWDIESNQTNNNTYSYRGSKNHSDVTYNSYPKQETKIVLPDNTGIGDDSIVVQYDKPWKLIGNYYSHETSKFVKVFNIENENHDFVGGVDWYDNETRQWVKNFAVYNSTANEPAYILAGISEEEFRQLLYSNSNLSSLFTQWLYDHVTVTYPHKGQKYIDDISTAVGDKFTEIGAEKTYINLIYPMDRGKINFVLDNFRSIKSIIGTQTTALSPLKNLCSAL